MWATVCNCIRARQGEPERAAVDCAEGRITRPRKGAHTHPLMPMQYLIARGWPRSFQLHLHSHLHPPC